MGSGRPSLAASLDAAEFRRWYWLKEELVAFARHEGISSSGDKPALADRIAQFLDTGDRGSPVEGVASGPRTISRRLPSPLERDTLLGPRQAASQQLRTFFVREIGSAFFYDIHMRTFLASEHKKTLGEAVAHWYATRLSAKPETLPQLELVRFMKAWHSANPNGTQFQCREAWKQYKALPSDERLDPSIPLQKALRPRS